MKKKPKIYTNKEVDAINYRITEDDGVSVYELVMPDITIREAIFVIKDINEIDHVVIYDSVFDNMYIYVFEDWGNYRYFLIDRLMLNCIVNYFLMDFTTETRDHINSFDYGRDS